MLVDELFSYDLMLEAAKLVFARQGDQIVKKYRCNTGRKKGRMMDHPSECSGQVDLKKKVKYTKTLDAKGARKRKEALKVNNENS